MKYFIVPGILLLVFGTGVVKAQTVYTLHADVTGAIPGKGQAIAALFSTPDNYLVSPIQESVVAIDSLGSAHVTFDSLDAGTYAVSIIYDEDNDGELDTGFMRIPTELIAMSNNAKGRFGPPSFSKTSFVVRGDTTIALRFGKAKD